MISDSSPTVYVVDDDTSILRAIARLLSGAGYRVETYSSPRDFIQSSMGGGVGCVVLDMHMPEFNGLEVQHQLASKGGALSVIFLTAHGQIDQCVDALKSGAVDFLTKPVTDDSLLSAVATALQKSEARYKKQREINSLKDRLASLSPREYQVFCLVVTGLLNKQIAAELGTSEKTIKVHRARVTEKMCAGSLAELVVMAGRLGVNRK